MINKIRNSLFTNIIPNTSSQPLSNNSNVFKAAHDIKLIIPALMINNKSIISVLLVYDPPS